MSLRRGRARTELMSDINVVSLIDVMMLLLVIFMITAPIMQGGVDVKLPTAEAKPLEPKSGLVVTVLASGYVYVDNEKMPDSEFRSSFKSLAAKRAKDGVYVRADASANYQRILDIISIMRRAGVQDVGLVTEPLASPGK